MRRNNRGKHGIVRLVGMLFGLLVMLPCPVFAGGDDTAGLGGRLGKRKIELWPPRGSRESDRPIGEAITLGGWEYRAVKSDNPSDAVPWRLIVTPAGPGADQWIRGPLQKAARPRGFGELMPVNQTERPCKATKVPIIKVPDIVWKKRMATDLQQAVGIHFHEYLTDDVARILFTLHKVPPDNADGLPPKDYPGKRGVRIEATLLAPILFHLDQSVVVRDDPIQKELAKTRSDHEFGHAQVSQKVFPAVLQGPQDWKIEQCQGRRSCIAYYWKRELIGRSWKGYERDVGRLLTLRTSIVLVPPSRWSLLLPVPPERVTQRTLQQFNDALVRLGPTFEKADKLAQDRFHVQHGAYE